MPKLIDRPQLIEIAQTAAGLLPVVTEGFRKGIDLISVKQVGDNTLRFIISNGSLDRDRDTIASDGWELANYRKNPVVLWAHSHSSPPIGKANAILIEDDALIAEAEFTGPDLNAFGDMIFKLYQGGFMRAVSVGFMPLEWVWVDEQGGFRFEKQELLEFSAVPVPANPEALLVARASGIDTSAMKAWAEKLLDEWPDNDHLGLTNKDMKRLAKAADSKHKSYHNLNNKQQKDLRERNLEAIWTSRLNEFDDDDQNWFKDWGPAPSEWDHAEMVAADAIGKLIGNGTIPENVMIEYSKRHMDDVPSGDEVLEIDKDVMNEIPAGIDDEPKVVKIMLDGEVLGSVELDYEVCSIAEGFTVDDVRQAVGSGEALIDLTRSVGDLQKDHDELIKLRERLEHLGISDIDTLELDDVEVTAEEQASIKDLEEEIVKLKEIAFQWQNASIEMLKQNDILQTENDELTESVIESELSKEMETEKSAVVMVLQAVKAGVNRLTGRID